MDGMLNFDRHARGKALFAEDFDIMPASRAEPEVIEPTFSPAELAAAEAEAWQTGHDAATSEATASDSAAIRDSVAAVAVQFAAACDGARQIAEQSAEATARLLLGCLAVALPALCERHGEAELRAVTRIVLSGLFREPVVTLRVHPRHADALRDEIGRHDSDLAARIEIVPTESIALGDARIAWRNGGASRDAATLWTQVAEALSLTGLPPLTAIAPEVAADAAPEMTEELAHAG